MNAYIGKRQSGKTSKLIIQASGCNGYIICSTANHCRNLYNQAIDMGYNINYPITFKEFLEKRYHSKNVKKFFIDDLDVCLQSLSSVKIEGFTMTADEIVEINGKLIEAIRYPYMPF